MIALAVAGLLLTASNAYSGELERIATNLDQLTSAVEHGVLQPKWFWDRLDSIGRQARVRFPHARIRLNELLSNAIQRVCGSERSKVMRPEAECIEEELALLGLDRTTHPAEPSGQEALPSNKELQGQPTRYPVAVFPPWKGSESPRPDSVSNPSLTAEAIFRSVAASIYVVRATGAETSQGSAVAVSAKEAITNCHVVSKAKRIRLSQAGQALEAIVSSADERTDRCILTVTRNELRPVRGLRDFSRLAVGETVYSVGSPHGLVNSLGEGIISGLREAKGLSLIQITAPVSPGSSGGGLFDSQGNLIGITTFTLRDSQNLNFAIAASEYWR